MRLTQVELIRLRASTAHHAHGVKSLALRFADGLEFPLGRIHGARWVVQG